MTTKIIAVGLGITTLLFVGLFVAKQTVVVIQPDQNQTLGAIPGGTFTQPVEFKRGTRIVSPVFTGASTTLTSASTSAITATQVCGTSAGTSGDQTAFFTFNPTNPSAIPASTTLPTAESMFTSCLTTNGDSISFYLRNISTSASTTIIKVASASTTLVGTDATSTVSATGAYVNGTGLVKITLIRAAKNLMYAVLQRMVAL